MENAAQALKMAAAVIVFAIALSIAIFMLSKARSTADIVLQTADKTRYYQYEEYAKNSKANENRIVGQETIIPMLYKYSKENYRIIFKKGTYNEATGVYNITGSLEIYKTKTNITNWDDSYTNEFDGTRTTPSINVFDLSEEIKRHEDWTISTERIEQNIKELINGDGANNASYASLNNPLKNRDNKYLELIGKIKKDPLDKNQTVDKTIITYMLITN